MTARSIARPLILGLTGSIGMGKSTVAAMFADEAVPVFDADATVHRLQGPAAVSSRRSRRRFPAPRRIGVWIGRSCRRPSLAMTTRCAAGGDRSPAVAEERAAFLAANADAPFVVFDIPLLFETGGDAHVDRIAVVSAAPEVQRARTLARPGMTPAKFDAILARQMPDAEKRARADVVIATDVAIDQTREAVRRVIACMRAEAGG